MGGGRICETDPDPSEKGFSRKPKLEADVIVDATGSTAADNGVVRMIAAARIFETIRIASYFQSARFRARTERMSLIG